MIFDKVDLKNIMYMGDKNKLVGWWKAILKVTKSYVKDMAMFFKKKVDKGIEKGSTDQCFLLEIESYFDLLITLIFI